MTLDKPGTGPDGWAAPASHAYRPGPGDAVASLPDAPPPAWAGPFAAPSPAPAPPVATSPLPHPFAPPAATAPQPLYAPVPPLYAPVPPPPIAPDGPGHLPYGCPAAGHGYGWPGMQPAQDNGMGTAALSLGILAAICFCLWPLAIVLGVLAVIFGGIGRGKARRGEATNGGQALAGIVCGAAGIVLGLAMIAFYASTTGP
ncbi:DUF4190 domain-containing protein [Streptomyces sp. NPDC004542]|uniref:DUF4190 domain-containing protein n=1 Tax=Streptomyces sp. NPDC004542 TaxID=3154281 RepID=UPI0033B1E566